MSARCDIAAAHAGLAARVAEIATALVGEPNRRLSSKRQLRFGRKGSLAVTTAGPKTGSWYDHENGVGGDLFSLIRRKRGGGFLDALAYAERIIGRRPTQPESPATAACRDQVDDCSAWNRRRAGELWQEAVPITATVASRYLATRRLYPLVDSEGRVLRFHPSCRYDTTRHPCLLALMRDVRTDEPRAIQRTALKQTGEKIGRMTLGPKTGAAIKLSADEDVTMGLAVGEGVETVLSAMQMGFTPAWALGDAGNVRAFPVLSGIECLTIVVDNDEGGTGQRAALECSMRWTGAGREVFRVIPDRRGDDMNNVVQRTDA